MKRHFFSFQTNWIPILEGGKRYWSLHSANKWALVVPVKSYKFLGVWVVEKDFSSFWAVEGKQWQFDSPFGNGWVSRCLVFPTFLFCRIFRVLMAMWRWGCDRNFICCLEHQKGGDFEPRVLGFLETQPMGTHVKPSFLGVISPICRGF